MSSCLGECWKYKQPAKLYNSNPAQIHLSFRFFSREYQPSALKPSTPCAQPLSVIFAFILASLHSYKSDRLKRWGEFRFFSSSFGVSAESKPCPETENLARGPSHRASSSPSNRIEEGTLRTASEPTETRLRTASEPPQNRFRTASEPPQSRPKLSSEPPQNKFGPRGLRGQEVSSSSPILSTCFHSAHTAVAELHGHIRRSRSISSRRRATPCPRIGSERQGGGGGGAFFFLIGRNLRSRCGFVNAGQMGILIWTVAHIYIYIYIYPIRVCREIC